MSLTHQQGLWLTHGICSLFGFTAIFAKVIQLPVPVTIFFRAFLGLLGFVLLFLFTRPSLRLKSLKDLGLMITLGMLMGSHWVTYFYAVYKSTAAIGVIAIFCFPLISAVLEPIFLEHKFKVKDLVLATIAFAGIWQVVPEFNFQSDMTIGVLSGVLSAFLLSFRNIMLKPITRRYRNRVIMFYQLLVTSCMLAPALWLVPWQATAMDWVYLLILGVVFTAGLHTLIITCIEAVSVTTYSIITMAQPVYTVIYAWVLLAEVPTVHVIVGAVVVLGTGVYKTLSERYA